MGLKDTVNALIDANIYANGQEKITGQGLNATLKGVVEMLPTTDEILTGINGTATESNAPNTASGFFRYAVTAPITTGSAWGIEVTQAELDDNWVFFNVKDGVITKDLKPLPEGRGIVSIVKTATVGDVDTYTILYTDGSTSTFNITNSNKTDSSEILYTITDKEGEVLAFVDSKGEWFFLNDKESLQAKLNGLQFAAKNNNGSDGVLGFADAEGKLVIGVDRNGEMFTTGSSRSIQESAVSNYIFRALRYEKAGNALLAKHWYDRAENDLKIPIRMDAFIAGTGEDSSLQRIPAMTKISDGKLLYMWQQIKRPGVGDGQGVRLVYSIVDYDIKTRKTTIGERKIFEQPAGWNDALGFAGHAHLITLPSKIICIFNYNDNPAGTEATGILNIYKKESTNGGLTWTDKVKVFDAAGTAIPRAIAMGSQGDFIQLQKGPKAGRLIFPIYDGVLQWVGYSDDNGATWQQSAKVNMTVAEPANENTVAERSDGKLIMSARVEGTNWVYAISSDNGETWEYMGNRPNWPTINCNSSMVQASLNPNTGFDKMLWSGLDNGGGTFTRKGLVIRVSHDDGVTYQTQYRPLSILKFAGYSNIRMLGQDLFAVAYESGFNTECSVHLFIANMSEVYKSGTQNF